MPWDSNRTRLQTFWEYIARLEEVRITLVWAMATFIQRILDRKGYWNGQHVSYMSETKQGAVLQLKFVFGLDILIGSV